MPKNNPPTHMTRAFRRPIAGAAWALGLGLLMISACGEDKPEVDCAAQPIPKFSQLAIVENCATCHSTRLTGPARQSAPEDVNYNTYEEAKKHAEEGASEVLAREMPRPNPEAVTEAERQAFYLWALCGTPE